MAVSKTFLFGKQLITHSKEPLGNLQVYSHQTQHFLPEDRVVSL